MPERVTVADLAAVLHEPKSVLLARVLGTRGEHRCVAILAEALTCEAEGGMRTTDGSRRRSPGGVFLHLVRERATAEERAAIFRRAGRRA